MSGEQAQEIRDRLDTDLSIENFEYDYRSAEEAATQFFQNLFVQVLNFDETTSPLGDAPWQDLPAHEWARSARADAARLFAEAGNFRVIYVELETLTRTAERNTIQSLTRSDRTSGWAIPGSFLVVFHAPDEDIWHLVTPYEEGTSEITTGRPVLRRYTLGEGETHRTVASALADMDASTGRLAERIDEAFRVKPVTEDFYENYKRAFDTLSTELREDLEIEEADRYAHVTLNRLMFFYYLQKKGWIGDRKDFVRWFHEQYEQSDDSDQFHEKWLSSLFFDGMNQPAGEPVGAELPAAVEETISEIAYMNGGLFQPDDLDENDTFLSDATLNAVIRGFLEEYNFTVTEESPYDIDVAVDPAMLGKIYESLIAEQERGEAGIFYTPRVEVDLMCRMALYEQFCDHATDLDADGKRRIVEFVFTEPQDWDPKDAGETEVLEEILHELRIVDPACGSGAFLVGMKQVLTELYRKLDSTPGYYLKEQIISENLYGVDIKDWAIRVAEFRLWLSLVEGEDDLPDQRPVLPNFSFKLKVGDSLIQKLDGEFVSLDTLTRTLDGDTGDLLAELKELKREHFEGEADRTEEIEEKQVELLRQHINGLIENLSTDTTQHTLTGDSREDLDDGVKERIEELEEVRDAIDDAGDTGFFMWDIDFSDVMVEGGFDVVIGNPPYVRQEEIIDQGIHPERLEEMEDSEVKKLKKQYKNDLVDYVEETFDISPYKRSDIYVYFYFKGLEVLRENGTLSYITSNSWLDIGYGKRLQQALLEKANLSVVMGNISEKAFEDADVNAYITMMNKSQNGFLGGETKFTRINRPYVDLNYESAFESIFIANETDTEELLFNEEPAIVYEEEDIRTLRFSHTGLWRLGGGSIQELDDDSGPIFSEESGFGATEVVANHDQSRNLQLPTGSYDMGLWGRFVDAPTLYFEIWRDAGNQFTTIRDLTDDGGDLTRGITSGANKYFFVPRPSEDNKYFAAEYDGDTGELVLTHKDSSRIARIEPEYWMRPLEEIPEDYHDQFNCRYETADGSIMIPNLVLVKNREIKTSPIEPAHLSSVWIRIDDDRATLEREGKNALDYIELGEAEIWGRNSDKDISSRTTFNSRKPWHKQPTVSGPYILLTRYVNAKYQFHFNPCAFPVADNFYYLSASEEFDPAYLAGYLNSTLGWFMAEISSRTWTNALKFDKTEFMELPILDANNQTQSTVGEAIENLMERDLEDVFVELGGYNPDDVTIESVKEDRIDLDTPIFDELDLTNQQRERLYKEMVAFVRDRLMRQPDENPSLCETIAEHNSQYDYSR